MIDRKKLIESLEAMRPRPLLEETFSKLYKMSDAPRVNRSKSIIAYYRGLTQDAKDKQAITKWEVPSASDKSKTYTCQIAVTVKGGLFALAKEKWNARKFSEAFATADVKVHCSCPDFYWSGMKYNLGPNGNLKGNALSVSSGYKYEKPDVTYAPDKRDPQRKHVLCKHLLSVVSKLHANAFTIMKDAKTYAAEPIDPTIETQTEKKKKVGATKVIKETNQEKVRKTITENFANAVVNLHESGKLDDREVEPNEILPTPKPSDAEQTDLNDPLVSIDDVGVEDVDVSEIVSQSGSDVGNGKKSDVNISDTLNTNVTPTSMNDNDSTPEQDMVTEQTLDKDDETKEKPNPSDIVGN